MRPVNTHAGSLLIVDDNEAFTQLLAWEFEDLGYRVDKAADCRQADWPGLPGSILPWSATICPMATDAPCRTC